MRKIALLLIGVLAATGLLVAGIRIAAPIPFPKLMTSGSPTVVALPGQAPTLANVSRGSLAVVAQAMQMEASDADTPRPIASVAKVMTALAVLDVHPIPPGQAGPTVPMTSADVAFWNQVVAEDGSNLRVVAGETLTERDLLEALLLPSANNIAFSLAVWTDGSVAEFLARLNRKAVAMGLHKTVFTDPSGLDAGTVSSASDLVKLAQVVIANPTLAQIVALPMATMSNAETVTNRDQNLSVAGWLGIKTGTSNDAGHCLLFAVQRVLPGSSQPVVVFGALLGQSDAPTMFALAAAIADSVFANLGWVDTSTLASSITATLHDAWHTTVPLNVGKPAAHDVLVQIGTQIQVTIVSQVLAAENQAAGSKVGELDATLRTTQISWPLTLASPLPPAPLSWRLARN